jgi:hypothetical protein
MCESQYAKRMATGVRRRAPVAVKVAATVLLGVGGVLITLALMAAGVLLSGMQVDPATQGTGYLDFLLFFNAALCLLPVDLLVILLGVRLLRGDNWAWLGTLVLCGIIAPTMMLAVWLLPAPLPFGAVPATLAVTVVSLLCLPSARNWCAEPDPGLETA